jgi:hypothetical protein
MFTSILEMKMIVAGNKTKERVFCFWNMENKKWQMPNAP